MIELDSQELDYLKAHDWIIPGAGTFGWWEHPKLSGTYTAAQALDITKKLMNQNETSSRTKSLD